MDVYAGRTLLIHDVPKPHLHFVLTEPEGQPPQVVLVPLNTRRLHSDTTVVLNRGDHRFIVHESVVTYSKAIWAQVSKIKQAVASAEADCDEDMSEDLLQRVRDGLLASPYTVLAVKEYCAGRF